MPPGDYLRLMLVCYFLTVAVEGPLLVALLSRRHALRLRAFAGVWLTACTYPVVWLVLPSAFEGSPRWLYLLAAETFAPVAECAIFWWAFVRPLAREMDEGAEGYPKETATNRRATTRDLGAIVIANLCSFGVGEVLIATGAFA